MTDLTPPTNSLPATKTTPHLSRELNELLDATGSSDGEASWTIAALPELLDEARKALPMLRQTATDKAGHEGVKRVVHRRFPAFPQPQRTAEEWEFWWADYYDVLAGESLASLEAGMRAYVAMPGSEFLPKPGRLLELARSTPSRSMQRYQRAKRAVALADEASTPRLPALPSAEPADVKAMLAEFTAQSSGAAPAKPDLPYIGGIPDEGGITAEMRALIARRTAERMA